MPPQSVIVSIDAIPQEQLRGQRILVRIDAQDVVNLSDALSTLVFLSKSGARVIVATHSPVDELFAVLTRLLGRTVATLEEWKGEAFLQAIRHLPKGEITMIKDLALEPGEDTNDDELVDALSHLCDIYCNEAFTLSHELRASTVGVTRKAGLAVAGHTFHRDLRALEALLQEPQQHVLAVLGGLLSKDKLLLAEQVAKGSHRVLVAGQLCFPFLIARRVVFHGPAVSDELITIAERMLTDAKAEKRFILTPVDFTVVERLKFERLALGEPYLLNPPAENVREHQIQPDHVICDIGTVTQWSWTEHFAPARKIFWHGPVGITEIDLFRAGTRFLAEQLALRTSETIHHTVVCGSSLVAALRSTGFRKENHIYLTPAGQAALRLFAGVPLPAVEALRWSAGTEHRRCRVLIPLDGSDRDVDTLGTATGILPRNAQLFLLHVRSGLDEEQYPDLAAALSDADRLERRLESERIFARANAALAACGLFSTDQVTDQGKRAEVITRQARRLKAELIVAAAGSRELNALRGAGADSAHSTLITRPNAEGEPCG